MTDAQLAIFYGRMERGLQLSVLRTLRKKVLMDRDVIYARRDGLPFSMSAREALRIYKAAAPVSERR